jgi:hypothetical protein
MGMTSLVSPQARLAVGAGIVAGYADFLCPLAGWVVRAAVKVAVSTRLQFPETFTALWTRLCRERGTIRPDDD